MSLKPKLIEGRLTIDITSLKTKELCPCCLVPIEKPDKTTFKDSYFDYQHNCRLIFKSLALPLCHRCWRDFSEVCEGCACPLDICGAEAFGIHILKHVTVTNCNRELCDKNDYNSKYVTKCLYSNLEGLK